MTVLPLGLVDVLVAGVVLVLPGGFVLEFVLGVLVFGGGWWTTGGGT